MSKSRSQITIRCKPESKSKLTALAVRFGFTYRVAGERVGAINQLMDAIADGELELSLPEEGEPVRVSQGG